MNRLKIKLLILLTSISIASLTLSACDQPTAIDSSKSTIETHSLNPVYGKTGAPISIEYSLPSKIEVGQTIEIELSLSSTTVSGKMTVFLNVGSSLILLSDNSLEKTLISNDLGYTKLTNVVRLETTEAGLSYLNIIANEFDLNGKPLMSRAFSIPVQVGDIKAKQLMPTLGKKSKSGDEELIEMVAE